MYNCYVIKNGPYTYCGITNRLDRRIRQHNGDIKGGAKYTTSKLKYGRWQYVCYVSGFKSKVAVLRFEWHVKHCNKVKRGGINNRINKLLITLNNKPLISKDLDTTVDKLCLNWYGPEIRDDYIKKKCDIKVKDYVDEYVIFDN